MAQPKKQGLPRHSRVVDGNVARSASYQQTGKRTVVDMLSNPSTDVAQKVNLRIPAVRRSNEAEEALHSRFHSQGRRKEGSGIPATDRQLPKGLACRGCGSTKTTFQRLVYGAIRRQLHSCDDCRRYFTLQDISKKEVDDVANRHLVEKYEQELLQEKEKEASEASLLMEKEHKAAEALILMRQGVWLPDAEEGNSTKDLDGNGRFLGQDHNIQPPSKRPAKGTEKEFEPPLANAGCDDSGLGVQIERFQAQEKTIDPAFNEMNIINPSKARVPTRPFTKGLYGHLNILDSSKRKRNPASIAREFVDSIKSQNPTTQFVDNIEKQVKDDLESRFFTERRGLFFNKDPSKRSDPAFKRKTSSDFVVGIDKNLGENPQASCTQTGIKAQEKTPDFNLATPVASSGSRLPELMRSRREENQGGRRRGGRISGIVGQLQKKKTEN